jgi:hypothetical protein
MKVSQSPVKTKTKIDTPAKTSPSKLSIIQHHMTLDKNYSQALISEETFLFTSFEWPKKSLNPLVQECCAN